MTILQRMRGLWASLVILGVLALCLLGAIQIVSRIDHLNTDYISFHLAGYLVVHNGDPYNPDQWVPGHGTFNVSWISDQTFIYPLPLSLLFVPLSLLPLYQSFIGWVTLSEVMILLSLFLIFQLEKRFNAWRVVIPLLAGLFLFRPTILTLVNGQLTAFLLLILTGAIVLWSKGRWEWGAFLLSLLILKPNLGGPILLLLCAWLLYAKKYKALLAVGVGWLFLLVIGLIQDPNWVQRYLGIGSGKILETFGFSPTTWGLASLVCGFDPPCNLILGGIFGILLLVPATWLVASRRIGTPLGVVSLIVSVALLVTPYSWTYDQLLLVIPIAAITLAYAGRKEGVLPAFLISPGMAILSLLLLIPNTSMGVEIFNALLPQVVLILLVLTSRKPSPFPSTK